MNRVPEAFMIFRAELKRVELEKERLRKEYEEKIAALNAELGYLKEQISSQQEMLQISFDYVSRLEKEMDLFKDKMATDQDFLKTSFH